jgi:hypothetical protein
MPEIFWFQDPLVLIHPKYLHRFFPSERLHLSARMNSIVRACAYIGITLTLIRRNPAWLLLPLVSLGFTASWMYRENPSIMKSKNKHNSTSKGNQQKDTDIDYLVSVILDGHPMENEIKRKKHKQKKSKKITEQKVPDHLFRDTDTIMQELQKERAEQTDSVGGRVPDTPNFARKLLGMDSR